MSAEEIKKMWGDPEHIDWQQNTFWLKEIAYQLAMMNERENRKAYPLLKRDESGNIVEVQP